MSGKKLNFRFHNPNPPELSCEYIIRILVEANQKKLDQALCAASEAPSVLSGPFTDFP
ncbi:MAG: hypothetical protein LKK00_05130 [Intestinimonas sp.]|nr:hypothetical protein [Intestinimonas sp.]